MSDTRLFFVVQSEESNEEIFETLEQAQAYRISVIGTEKGSSLKAALVRHAFKEDDYTPERGQWNYEDQADTFQYIKTM